MNNATKWSTAGMWIVITIVVAAAIIGIIASSSPSTSATNQGSLSAEHRQYNFGTITMSNGIAPHDYSIKNSSSQAVTLRRIVTSCMCTKAQVIDGNGSIRGEFGMPGHGGVSGQTNITVAAGESIVLRALFDPNAHGPSGVGAIDRVITIETNSEKTPTLQLGFTGTVVP